MTAAGGLTNSSLAGAELQNGVQEGLYGDPKKLTTPIKAVQDKYELLPAFLKVRCCPPLGNNISFNRHYITLLPGAKSHTEGSERRRPASILLLCAV